MRCSDDKHQARNNYDLRILAIVARRGPGLSITNRSAFAPKPSIALTDTLLDTVSLGRGLEKADADGLITSAILHAFAPRCFWPALTTVGAGSPPAVSHTRREVF